MGGVPQRPAVRRRLGQDRLPPRRGGLLSLPQRAGLGRRRVVPALPQQSLSVPIGVGRQLLAFFACFRNGYAIGAVFRASFFLGLLPLLYAPLLPLPLLVLSLIHI